MCETIVILSPSFSHKKIKPPLTLNCYITHLIGGGPGGPPDHSHGVPGQGKSLWEEPSSTDDNTINHSCYKPVKQVTVTNPLQLWFPKIDHFIKLIPKKLYSLSPLAAASWLSCNPAPPSVCCLPMPTPMPVCHTPLGGLLPSLLTENIKYKRLYLYALQVQMLGVWITNNTTHLLILMGFWALQNKKKNIYTTHQYGPHHWYNSKKKWTQTQYNFNRTALLTFQVTPQHLQFINIWHFQSQYSTTWA